METLAATSGVDSLSASIEPYVVAWPAAELALDGDFEIMTQSSVITSSLLHEHEGMQDSLLDALSRLDEERARNARLLRQVEVANALAGRPNGGEPSRASTKLGAGWRARAARQRAAALRRAAEDRAARLLQARARLLAARHGRVTSAATRLQDATRMWIAALRDPSANHAVRRELVTLRAEHVAVVREHAAASSLAATRFALIERKDVQLDAAVERQVEAFNTSKLERIAREAAEARAVAAEARAEEAEIANAVAVLRRDELGTAASAGSSSSSSHAPPPSAFPPPVANLSWSDMFPRDYSDAQPVMPDPQPMQPGVLPCPPPPPVAAVYDDDETVGGDATDVTTSMRTNAALSARLAYLEGLTTKLNLEKANLAMEVDESRHTARALEEKLTEARLAREEAEDTASRLLMEAMHKDESAWLPNLPNLPTNAGSCLSLAASALTTPFGAASLATAEPSFASFASAASSAWGADTDHEDAVAPNHLGRPSTPPAANPPAVAAMRRIV